MISELIRRSDIGGVITAKLVPEGFAAILARYLHRGHYPIITLAHGEELNAYSSSRELSALARWSAKRIDGVVANSNNTAGELASLIAKNKIKAIKPGADIPNKEEVVAARRNGRERFKCGEKAVVLLSIARLEAKKNHIRVIRAINDLSGTYSNIKYLIAGAGSQEEFFKSPSFRSRSRKQSYFFGRR